MSSEGPYGRHGFNANPSGYGGSYSNPPQGGYAAPSYGGAPGQGYGGSYTAPAPASGGSYGGASGFEMVSHLNIS